ncbi:ArnT family glycosyltransferase [Francisella adeliensis]|uniref:4-amino-4-deoxy-L-arabinose transferase n=1 Tax=Francisella adeliensis TaxID=2007306 RepID=A0A2Z4XZD3_9GAMM|nr:glycosyltransferase family 39 protein [Francisella adeliensis]AXA33795.1 4-amino-4-deoxy-L-arabinose transferase [Francisella adeliensis]MBK2085694.1 glycosyltransferase family 39 protein [Francisella adeliensis]MBK2097572.1 glycosyltransferase family 39 protein [Francisella adeliensis]QIW12030.1 glycosyltransferase family 39 protein [Francisella adeliensis]QIW13905.1 glycosyltransferase family 39 protein [Francisella adeliensis]
MNKTLKDILIIIGVMIVAFCMYGVPSFYSPDETRYSEVAREMIVNHNFIVPHINGVIFFHKPPIIYWLTCAFMSVFGENTWGARLVNPVLLTICLVFAYYVISKILKSRALGLYSIAVASSSVMLLFIGRYLNMDLAIAVFLNMTILSYWMSLKYDDNYLKSTFWLLLAFIFSGLAVMTKGLIGIVFPMAIVGLYSLLMGQYKRLFDIRLYIGLIIVAVISLPWIYAVEEYHPHFAYYYIVVQQILRFSVDEQNRDVAKYIYLFAAVAAIFPWTFFLPQVFKNFFSKEAFKDRKNNQDKWFLFVWFIFIFIFFGLSKSFLFGYLAPMILPLAILIAFELEKLSVKQTFSKWDKASFILPIFIFSLLPIVTIVVLCIPTFWSNIFKFIIYLVPVALVSIVIVYKSIYALKAQNIKQLVGCFCVMLFVIANFGYASGEYFDFKDTKPIISDISKIRVKYPSLKLYTSDRFYQVAFYTKEIPTMINDEGELDDVKNFKNSEANEYLTNYPKFIKQWNRATKLELLVVINKPDFDSPKSLKDYKHDIDKDKFYIIDSTKYASLVANKNIKV